MWPRLVGSARLRWSGAVALDAGLLSEIVKDLRTYTPWPASEDAGTPAGTSSHPDDGTSP
jgi:hypothetical protein